MIDLRGELPDGEEKVRAVRTMFDAIAGRYDRVNRIMTLGMDVRWRRLTVESLGLSGAGLVLDLACGTGDLCEDLRTAGYECVGFDMSEGMLKNAHTVVPLCQADVLRLPVLDACAEGATCGFALRNLSSLAPFFAELFRVLTTDGRIALLDVSSPTNPILRAGHSLYFRKVVPLIGGWLSVRSAYDYLPRSTAYLPAKQQLVELLEAAGFKSVRHRAVNSGIVQILTATKP